MSKHRRHHARGAAVRRVVLRAARRSAAPAVVVAVASAALPWGSSATAGTLAAPAEPAFGGYRTSATAAPVTLQFYEPTVPIPSEPQLEVRLGYTVVEGDSGSSKARAAYVWPGDPVGEGFKTFADQLGFPPEVGEAGYPFQVNAGQPSGEAEQRDEPFPGMLQRAEAGEGTARAVNGYSADGESQDDEDDGDSGDEDPGGGDVPGLPGLPALPGLAAPAPAAGEASGADDESPVPPELTALVDVEGFTTASSFGAGDQVRASARSALGRVRLLGGLVTSAGMTTVATARGDGETGTAEGRTSYGDLVVLGQRFRYGPDGFEAAGGPTPIPGLPDDAGAALQRLGVTVALPPPGFEQDGDQSVADVPGLVLEIDVRTLKENLRGVPLDEIIGAVPDETGELKDTIALLARFSPRVVVTLGGTRSVVETTPPLDPTAPPSEEPGEEEPAEGSGGGGASASTGGLGATGGTATDPGAVPDVGPAPSTAGDLPGTTPLAASPGLPPLFSIPGALLLGALALATVGGGYVRKLGVLALGGGAACPHGLDTGLPDLRKA